ncbi:MAG: DNA polymerase III subunit alpha, partial [Alphaproteobacteria bacterium]|nr:DNA polymerase III subunit alpha [Alphaproteobacteria bacterium]
MNTPGFIHLRVHSAYSLLEGAIGVKELVKWCVRHRMPAVAIADHGNLFGSLEFSQGAVEAGVQPIMAMALFLKQEEAQAHHAHPQKPDQLLLYAKDETGWRNLLFLASQAYLSPAGPQGPLLAWADLEGHSEGLIALTGGIYGTLGRHVLSGQHGKAAETLALLMRLFPGRLYVELMRHSLAEEERSEAAFIALALEHGLPLVATNDAYFIDESMFEAHDAFLCIAEGTYVVEENRRRLTPNHRLKTPQEMCALFADVPEALANTLVIAQRCAFAAPSRKPILPNYIDESGNSDADAMLRHNARSGLAERLEKLVFAPEMDQARREAAAAPYRERLEFEIDTIIRMQFPGYFLIVSDFIRWSKANGIPVGPGRGSGAGSVVAWALDITDLDPLRYGLLFERFLNPERVSMPDFDVDFCQDRRDEVIAYVTRKYGYDRVAQIITFGKLQARAVLRDVGRVLQVPYDRVDRICKLVPMNPAHPVMLKEAIEMEPMLQNAIRDDETVARLVDISLKLEGLNRHASTHAAGVVIGDRPLLELVPMYRDPKSDMPVVQYSMKYAEAAGLVKFDFLGLKTLTVLAKAVEMLRRRGIALDLLTLPEGDGKTYGMLANGDTVGVFQLEGAGMRDTVKKLKPDRLEEIIALVSLYRPGPMDNIPTYIARKHGHEKPEYLHPLLEPILKETFGVIIYQEQVMQIAQVLAGYSLGEADLLRRAMGKKIRSEMEAQRGTFVDKAVAKGVERQQAAGIFDLIAKFAEYGFNKSHAAAYAVVAYQTAYLKANYPVEFLAASMTCDMHNTDKLGVFREEADRFRIHLLPPDVNASEASFAVEGPHIRYALAAIRNVGGAAMRAVVEEREKGGPFRSVFDFVSRVPNHLINKRALEYLIKAGSFDALHGNRAQLTAAIDMLIAYAESVHRERETCQINLFGGEAHPAHVPELPAVPDWPLFERLHMECEAIGFYLSAHPLDAYRKAFTRLGVMSSARLPEILGDKYTPVKVAGIVTARKFKVSDKGRFAFFTLSDLSGVFECSIFSEDLLNRHRDK